MGQLRHGNHQAASDNLPLAWDLLLNHPNHMERE
jgi:hypothetical protein